MKKNGQRVAPEVVWRREEQTLTLEGEPVLRYQMAWPEICGGGLGGRWISRYYEHLARSWRKRWQREIYWKACLELAVCRSVSRPFALWTGSLNGEVTLWQDGLLSLKLSGEEVDRAITQMFRNLCKIHDIITNEQFRNIYSFLYEIIDCAFPGHMFEKFL